MQGGALGWAGVRLNIGVFFVCAWDSGSLERGSCG